MNGFQTILIPKFASHSVLERMPISRPEMQIPHSFFPSIFRHPPAWGSIVFAALVVFPQSSKLSPNNHKSKTISHFRSQSFAKLSDQPPPSCRSARNQGPIRQGTLPARSFAARPLFKKLKVCPGTSGSWIFGRPNHSPDAREHGVCRCHSYRQVRPARSQ